MTGKVKVKVKVKVKGKVKRQVAGYPIEAFGYDVGGLLLFLNTNLRRMLIFIYRLINHSMEMFMSNNKKQNKGQKLLALSSAKQKNKKPQDKRLLKDRFFEAVLNGELGSVEEAGVVVTLKAFKAYFSDITTQYVSSFMPAATFEPGRFRPSHTRFLFRLRKGAYLIHCDVLVAYMRLMLEEGRLMGADVVKVDEKNLSDEDPSVKEVAVSYKVL